MSRRMIAAAASIFLGAVVIAGHTRAKRDFRCTRRAIFLSSHRTVAGSASNTQKGLDE